MSKKQITDKDLRIFGILWIVVLTIAIASDYFSYNVSAIISIFLTIDVLLLVFKPELLTVPYKIWMKFGEFMNMIVTTIILIVLYYLIFVPFGMIAKLFGKDFLNKKINKEAKTYWIKRKTEINDMKYQF